MNQQEQQRRQPRKVEPPSKNERKLSPEISSIVENTAKKMGITGDQLENIIWNSFLSTSDQGSINRSQFEAFLLVCERYQLDPMTKQIVGWVKSNRLVIAVPIDGWITIVNRHPQANGCTFHYVDDPEDTPEKDKHPGGLVRCGCQHHRGDIERTPIVWEEMDECFNGGKKDKQGNPYTGPWDTHPRRSNRHKAYIQSARITYGISGIYDPDEAAAILDGTITPEEIDGAVDPASATLPETLPIKPGNAADHTGHENAPGNPPADQTKSDSESKPKKKTSAKKKPATKKSAPPEDDKAGQVGKKELVAAIKKLTIELMVSEGGANQWLATFPGTPTLDTLGDVGIPELENMLAEIKKEVRG